MKVRFERRDDGQVDAFLDSADYSLLQEALNDCVSSLPPRGMPGNGPSTYWIDVAERGARQAAAIGDDRPFTWGNVTLLRVVGDQVEATLDFDDEVVERIPLPDFLNLLTAWRAEVVTAASIAVEPLPETYRRNPAAH